MKYRRYIIIMLTAIIIINVTAWLSPALCDWYTIYLFPVWVNIFSRITNLFPFSVGEVFIITGILLVLAAIVIGIGFIFLKKKQKFVQGAIKYYKFFGIVLVNLGLIVTLNFLVLHHCSRLDPNPEKENRTYMLSELEILRNYIVEQCNYYAEIMERDVNGDITYDGDMQEKAKDAVRNLAEQYPKLAGYYPDVKYIANSNIMSQAYITGIYFPYSLEANCNANMYIANYPMVFCHELVHLKSYIYEDEAEFLAYLACIGSDDDFFRYSALLEVFYYVDEAYFNSVMTNGTEEEFNRYISQIRPSDLVYEDNIFLKEEAWEEVEEASVLPTDTVEAISDVVMDTNLKVNGVEEGIAAYSGVVELLLQYYDGILY